MVVWLFGGRHAGDSSDVTLAFEDAHVIPPFSKEESYDTDNTDNTYDTDDKDDTNDKDATDDTYDPDDKDDTNDTDATDDTDDTESTEIVMRHFDDTF